MPGTALAIYLAFFVVAIGWRMWLQYHRTGDHGFRGLSNRSGSVEWLGGISFVAGAALVGSAALADFVQRIQPIAAIDQPWLHRAGVVVALLGMVGIIVSQLEMRDSWRVGVDEREKTAMVASGVFALMRNPIYTGMFVVAIGMFLMTPNVLSVVAFGFLLFGLEIQVRLVEEPHLIRVHGEAYRAYARRVGRFLPWVGRLS